MKVKDFIKNSRKDFSVTIALIGVIPVLVFAYIMTAKIASVKIFVGEVGLITVLTISIFILGIVVGKRMFSSFVDEIIEKDRKAAITETALAVGHEINNPLLAIRGNLPVLESYIVQAQAPDSVKDRLKTIIDNFERIREATDKFSRLSNPKSVRVFGNINMVDIS